LTDNLMATLLSTGGVANPSGPRSYGVLAAGDSPQAHLYSFLATGPCGGNVTATLALSDGAENYGTVSFTFPLGLVETSAQSFSNAAPIIIADETAASPYPSIIQIANVTGAVTKVTVTLHSLSHTYASDLDMILAGPGGQSIMLMSDAGGGRGINGTITFDDDAPVLPGNTAIAPGTYAPHDYQGFSDDVLPPPAPAGVSATSLAAFNGLNPNGAWRLFVVDAGTGDTGSIAGGWSLQLSSPRAACCSGGPPLSITMANPGVLVSWPAASLGFALEAASTLSTPAPWLPVPNPVFVSNSMNNVSISPTSAARFFRLKK
jgi:subtilisin-like proprotein convertase family protein